MSNEFPGLDRSSKLSRYVPWIVSVPILVVTTLAFGAPNANAQHEKFIRLVETDGTEMVVGTIRFDQPNMTGKYSIDWDDGKFGDHFLSMRPFKCLEGPVKHWCRVPYPYTNRREIVSDDLTDLEYDLLFVWKGATEYGINMWNGVYYRLENVGGGKLVGLIHEMDMDKLAVPPDVSNLRPIREGDLEPGEPDSHWLPKIVIE